MLDHSSHASLQCFILFLRSHSGFTLVRCANPSMNSNWYWIKIHQHSMPRGSSLNASDLQVIVSKPIFSLTKSGTKSITSDHFYYQFRKNDLCTAPPCSSRFFFFLSAFYNKHYPCWKRYYFWSSSAGFLQLFLTLFIRLFVVRVWAITSPFVWVYLETKSAASVGMQVARLWLCLWSSSTKKALAKHLPYSVAVC